ncbi:MAG: branched-chain amino acid ABC transporter permease [Rhodospirillales bacterium]|jgi:branched-chain amino acid transport system permease protein|nr:branched-chain amino acid ABC transporter permease [Rhodospirillaceae bacterium]MDP6429666.1 branched-chain amino acid ABC transporter permease [Rhodospirillales bacterium]MDP6644159.1 branched-chain amino acid ABC transporter permease [Rhodospirillales bacterium]MDP6843523.1 branched-chain amino acid ABC transporter permease [Rhodospirillales bacterium]
MTGGSKWVWFAVIGIAGLAAPFLFPAFITQIAVGWLMVLFALTWDTQGGQMSYNSFGNVLFFGIGMYMCVSVQVMLFTDLGEYTAAGGAKSVTFTADQYVTGLVIGMIAGAIVAVTVAAIIGSGILGLRGHYFAIGTLGLGIAAGEIAGGWELIGAGSGISTPVFPDPLGDRSFFFYFFFMALAVVAFFVLRWLYSGRFGLAINAIRDDEDKAESMGLATTKYKTMSWCISAFFLALAGGPFGLLVGFVDPRDTAFAGITFGVWMVLMAILGGKGTIWGPVIGAVIFHITQELFWTFLLGWQRVALGALIVIIVVFFPKGILGWFRDTWPERFGHRVEEAPAEGGRS